MKKRQSDSAVKYALEPRLEIVGSGECYAEGIKEIAEYTAERIVLKFSKHSVIFSGDGLFISSFSSEGAVIEGAIVSMEFIGNA